MPNQPSYYTIEVKWGLGSRHGENFKVWHVVVDGHTLATYLTEEAAQAYAYRYMQENPKITHANK